MRVTKLLQAATVLCGAAILAPAHAEPEHTFFISPMGGVAMADFDDFDTGAAAHLGIGVNLSQLISLELKGFYSELDIDAPTKYRQKGASIDALFKFFRRPGIELYGVTGIGFVRQDVPNDSDVDEEDDSSVDPSFDLGLGALIPLGSSETALRADIRYRNDYHGDADRYGRSSFYQIISTVGLLFPYVTEANAGQASPPPPPVPVAPEPAQLEDEIVPEPEPEDSDDDGVIDDDDDCPNTPAGRIVDSSGCQLDDDDDGVVNADDDCPNTPEDVDVDAKGCQLDSDNDGVVDADDECPDTAAGKKVLPNGCSVAIKLVLEGVNFETDSSKLTRNAKAILDDVAETVIDSPEVEKLLVAGHTDARGSARYNQRLSEKRAASARRYLIAQGVEPSRLVDKGFGESKPVATNDTPEGQAKNRRVELSPMTDGDSTSGGAMDASEADCDCAADVAVEDSDVAAAKQALTDTASLAGAANAEPMTDVVEASRKAASVEPLFVAFSGRTLTGQARRQLDKLAVVLMKDVELATLELEGNASPAQAKSVHRYLVTQGVESKLLATTIEGNLIHIDYGS